jgi:Protein of unknown function (DUF1488)
MPLISEGNSYAVAHVELRAIGFWMTVKGAHPVQPVRVFVSYEVLADLDPTDIRDLATAFEHFDKFRTRIETSASDKFDRDGPDAENRLFGSIPKIRSKPCAAWSELGLKAKRRARLRIVGPDDVKLSDIEPRFCLFRLRQA